MSKTYRRTGPGSRAVLARACSAVSFQPLENRTLLSAALALDWGGTDSAYEVAIDGRGRVLVTGDSDNDLIMARFTRSGEELDLDASFGTAGGVLLDFEPFGIEVQADGKILLVGDDAEGTLLVARYNEDGTLDTSFAGDGTAEFNLLPDSLGNAIGIQPDGKIVAAGAAEDDFLVVRFERDGDLDTTFGSGGYLTTDFNGGGVDVALGLGILGDGRIAVGGASDETDYAIARYLPTGAPDATLGGDGTVSGPLLDYDDDDALNVTDFAVLADGRMLVLGDGSGVENADSDGVVYQFTPTGVEDRAERDSLFRMNPHDEIAAHGYDYVIATSWHDEETTDETGWHNHDFFAFGERTDFGGDGTNGLEFDEYVLGVALRDGVGAGVGVTGEDWGLFVTDYDPTGGPYRGTPYRPGETIQAEDFDYGRPRFVGYEDSDDVNEGGEYRVGGVDIGFTSDTGGGFAVGWTEPGERLGYSINVPQRGTYRFDVRVANPAPGARYRISLYTEDELREFTAVEIPQTGGWNDYVTVSTGPTNLWEGDYHLVLEMDKAATNGAVGNFNWLKVTPVTTSGTGRLDQTFGGDGNIEGPPLDITSDVQVGVGPGDSIVMLSETSLTKYSATGVPDTSFGNNGVLATEFDQINDVAVQSDGRIFVAGEKGGVFRVARYTAGGQLDASFSGDGVATQSFGGTTGADAAHSIKIQPDGKIVVSGAGRTATSGTEAAVVVVRYNANGSLDTSFDGDAYVTARPFGTGRYVGRDVEIAPDGKVVVLGNVSVGPPATATLDSFVLRFSASGASDATFDGDGVLAFGDDIRAFADLAVQDDGRILLAGSEVRPAGSPMPWTSVVRRLTSNGAIDTSFGGGDGDVEGLFVEADSQYAHARALQLLPSGDIIVAGGENHYDNSFQDTVSITRLNPDGSIDYAYVGEGGYIGGLIAPRSFITDLGLQRNGGLLVAGEHENAESHLMRFDTFDPATGGEPGGGGDGEGPLDETFGDNGVTQVGSTTQNDFLDVATAVGPDDKVVTVGGNLITRRLPDGAVDTSFGGGDGVVEADFDDINDVAVQSDGKIVLVGRKGNLFRVARYTAAGQLDTTFSGDGITSRTFGGSAGSLNEATGVAIQSDGKIVVVGAGTSARYTNTGLVVVRYNANGSLDTTFDNDGYSLDHLSTEYSDLATDVDIDSQGRIVVGGFERTPASIGWVLRYTRTGSFDTSFSGDGRAQVPFYVDTLDVQGDNRIVVGGWGYESMVDYRDRVGRLTASGAMDPTFGGGDGVVKNVLTVHEAYSSSVNDVLVLSGGDIMIAGWNEHRDATEPHDSSALSRLNPDGSVHTEFTGEGNRYVVVPFGARSSAESLALQDGELIVAGNRGGEHLLLARYLLEDDGGGGGGEPGGDGTGLTGTYYSNIDFTGNSITRTDAAVNFNWGTGGPSSTIGTDTFSVRWTGQVEAEETGRYTFYTRTDDGVRLWVNNQLIIDRWVPQSATEWSGSIDLVAGQKYDIKMEYFERYGGALAELRWSAPNTAKEVVPTSQLFPAGTGTPADTQKPSMPPNLKATADHERVILDWDASTDNVGVVSYEIRRNSVHLATVGASQTTYTDTDIDPNNGYGYDVIAIDAAGNRSDEAFVNIMTPPAPPHVGEGLRGEYYSNIDFTGSTIARTDSNINFNWGSGGPSSTIGTDTFSARWTGQILAEKTEGYVFHTRTDDGVRLWVDGQLIIDKWMPQSATEHSGSIDLVAGRKYDIRMEYFERYGSALAELRWSSATTPKQIVPTTHLFSGGTGTPGDTQKPTMPPNLTATATDEQVVLDWDSSADNVGVTSYEIRRNQTLIASLGPDRTRYTDFNVEPGTTYAYEVFALDAAGNRSDPAAITIETEDPPSGGGLQALLYDNMDFTNLTKARLVQTVNFDWDAGSPDPEIGPDTFSVRFYGRVKPTKTERFTFYTNSDDGVRLTVNGQVLIDKLVPQSETEWSGSIELQAGVEYDIQLDYIERFGGASVQLFWSSPTTPKQIIPAANLEPGALG